MLATTDASRAAGLERLSAFLPKAGRHYAAERNYDRPGHKDVSGLSPYIRHRLVTEEEVVRAVLGRHSASAADKFLSEVFWRTYWKGWLELRPGVWADYVESRDRLLDEPGVTAASRGRTGIAAFDHWAQELRETGYLHNHARMWFASIWIFTLRLPWQAGADFFLRHLLDGDPASNTLSWRWVAGLQTRGKHYLARCRNIEKYTDGRFRPTGLNIDARPLDGPAPPARRDPPRGGTPDPALPTAVVLTEEDLCPDFLAGHVRAPLGLAALLSDDRRSPRAASEKVAKFTETAAGDALSRWSGRFGGAGPVSRDIDAATAWVEAQGAEQVVMPYTPTGPAASKARTLRKALAAKGIPVVEMLRGWDAAAWPHATHGYFRFKGAIPDLIDRLAAPA